MNVFLYNLNVGSGIEKIGNTILEILEDSNTQHYDITEYKMQNPACILIDDLVKARPDVIIMNEFYPRLITTAFFYKAMFPETKIILINHTLQLLRALPFDINASERFENVSKDGLVLLNYAFRDKIDTIINLNWYPRDAGLPDWLERKTTHVLFPVKKKEFHINVPFSERQRDFLYFGNVLPHKLSRDFIEKFSKTSMTLDIYGKLFPEHEEYNNAIDKAPNIKWLGYCPDDKVAEVMNSHRFFISARGGSEPFMTAMAEAIMSGMIPLVANDRSVPGSNWIDHYSDCYLEYQSVGELLKSMEHYLSNKHDVDFIRTLEARSWENSAEMTKRTSTDKLRDVLHALIVS